MYLLDTNALSEPLKKRPSTAFLGRIEAARGKRKAASVVSLMELRHGCARHPAGDRLWRKIEVEVLSYVELLPVDDSIALRAGDLMAEAHRRGRPRSTEDLLIAATALGYGLVLVTRNTSDFTGIPGLRIEDWMEPTGT